ncbi:DUF262 domain-containing protein [Gelidibacter sp. F63206]|uniref:DUF262 domain-containing protein n=1 Tax=Gelidibacter sp. F63206 TaxID=2926425 RepID=UPI001FF34E17|nr:DUF262 domain-containing protein [Gelidibacter sp. F63206]MCK0114860.1 DUF262 domain-containing protein [Gelidibacter sp. F63206]
MKELESLNKIFKDGIFKIPDYQRGYAWSTKQLKDFWEDINNLPSDKMHYTGVLTLKKVDEEIWKHWNNEGWLIKDRGYTPYHIVDGQQRLTTVVIFIQSLIVKSTRYCMSINISHIFDMLTNVDDFKTYVDEL